MLFFCAGLVIFSLPGFAQETSRVDLFSLLKKSIQWDSMYLPPVFSAGMQSSFDRMGGDQDQSGFLRKEGDWYVIAEMQGPGAISRIWSELPQGLIRIYVDNGSSPLIQCNFLDLFSGKLKPFVRPFVSGADDTKKPCWSYLPIPYARFCKVCVQELNSYQIEYTKYPYGTPVQPFPFPFPSKNEKQLNSIGNQYQTPDRTTLAKQKNVEEYLLTRTIAAGDRITLVSMEGPAIIRGILLQWHEKTEEMSRNLLLRIYWDDNNQPSVMAPLFDFFGGGVETLALGRNKKNEWYCFFPMPFQKTVQFSIENAMENDSATVDFSIYVQRNVQLPTPLRTFHAGWNRDTATPVRNLDWNPERKEFVDEGDENYTALSTKGSGHLIAWGIQSGEFPVSDTMIFILPQIGPPAFPGTGHYGLFDSAGILQTANSLFAGCEKDSPYKNFFFRSFLPAPIPFEEGALVTLEHGSGNTQRKDYASTVFWYQEETTSAPLHSLPPGALRFSTMDLKQPIIDVHGGKITTEGPWEAENLPVEAGLGIYDPQDMLPFGPQWSGNQQMHFDAYQIDGSIEFTLPKQSYSGWYHLGCQLTGDPSGAIVSIGTDKNDFPQTIDLYQPLPQVLSVDIPKAVYWDASEEPRVHFIVQGKNDASNGYAVGVDTIDLRPTKTTPESLELSGPFALPGNPEKTAPNTLLSADREPLLLGYSLPPGQPLASQTVIPSEKNGRYNLGKWIGEEEGTEGLLFFTWIFQAERPGIYRFDLEPAEATPFFFRQESDQMVPVNHCLLINGILLTGRDILRYDPKESKILPLRFRIPLQRGENKLAWLIRANTKTWIRPVLYGLEDTQTVIHEN